MKSNTLALMGMVVAIAATSFAQSETRRDPGDVRITLTSRIVKEPLPADMLADPNWRRTIADCPHQLAVSCGEVWTPVDSRATFSLSHDDQIIAFVELTDFQFNRDYNVYFRWVAPGENTLGSVNGVLRSDTPSLPKEGKLLATARMRFTSETPTGQWRLEVSINGQVPEKRLFTISE